MDSDDESTVESADESASEEPTPIISHGGVIFDAFGGQIPSNGGQPFDPETPEDSSPAPTVTTEDMMYDFARVIQTMGRTYRTPPNIAIQIIQTVLQYQLQQASIAASRAPMMPPLEES
jgi:hypothetical protein